MTAERKQLRCAIYTRKSITEGLEQDFNSLDAQRESGEALVVNEAEALRVQEIFNLYLTTQSLQASSEELNRRGITMKQWVTQKGILNGGSAFTKSALHGMLTNVAYIGQVNYKGHIAEAEFPGIVDKELFESVQQCLKENCQCAGARVRNKHHALLGGILRCGQCNAPMTHSHTSRRKDKVYCYYVCNRASKEGWDKCPSPSLPAREVEKFVVEEIAITCRPSGIKTLETEAVA